MSGVRVLIAAGGTGGHVFPALAIADELRRDGGDVMWLGAGGMEMSLAPAHGFPLHSVPFRPPRGLGGVLRLIAAVWRARRIVRRLRPAVVLGMGGYAAAPGGLAAKTAGVPLVIHEQNAVGGRANQLLCKVARQTLGGFPDALPGLRWVGNPVRREFCAVPPPSERVAESPPRRLLVLGGSQGAQALNTEVPAALGQLDDSFDVFHQCGRGNIEQTERAYHNVERRAEVREFMDDVAEQMTAADLIICRAGAATLAEIAAVGAASLLVPYPYAAGDHQNYNARFFAARKAAFVCSPSDFDGAWLADFLTTMTRQKLLAAANNARALSRPQAAADVARACLAEAKHAS